MTLCSFLLQQLSHPKRLWNLADLDLHPNSKTCVLSDHGLLISFCFSFLCCQTGMIIPSHRFVVRLDDNKNYIQHQVLYPINRSSQQVVAFILRKFTYLIKKVVSKSWITVHVIYILL